MVYFSWYKIMQSWMLKQEVVVPQGSIIRPLTISSLSWRKHFTKENAANTANPNPTVVDY